MEEYLHVFGRTGDSAVIIDSQQTIVYWNAAAEGVLGYPAREVVGRQCWQIFHGRSETGEPVCQPDCHIINKINRGETISHFNLVVKDNQENDVIINISTLNISKGEEKPHPVLVQLSHEVDTGLLSDGKLKIQLLGTTAVTRPEGIKVEGELWRRVKVRALLAYLALQRDHPVSRDTLVELLWPELDYNAALRNLNTTVYNLRKSLEPDLKRVANSNFVLYEGGNYFLSSDIDHWLDIDVFEEHIKQARFSASIEEAVQTYEKAIGLYRGEYLADLQTTAVWSAGEHFRLQELYLTTLEELGTQYEAIQQDALARGTYLKALSVDCIRESTVQKLMNLAIRQGDFATAQSHCRRLIQCLDKELGVAPSPVTQALCKKAHCEFPPIPSN